MVIDPIADMFSRIKNAQAVGAAVVLLPYSKLKMEIARAFLRRNFIKEINKRNKKNRKFIEITLFYEDKIPLIRDIKRVSKVSRRIYKGAKEIKSVRQGYGALILSTPKGILTDKEARKENVGGEIMCEIW